MVTEGIWPRSLASLLLLVGLLLCGSAQADVAPVDQLLLRFDALWSGQAAGETCATPLLLDLHSRWDELGPAQRHHVDLLSSPRYRAWLAEGGHSWLDGDVYASVRAGRDSCFPAAGIPGLTAGEVVAQDEHFVVRWGNGGAGSAEDGQQVLGYLQGAWERQIDALDLRPPPGTDRWQLLVSIESLNGFSGYMNLWPCGDIGWMPYLVLGASFVREERFGLPLSAHELFHAVQTSYAFDEMTVGWEDSLNRWWFEASAVHAEGMTWPEWPDLIEWQSADWAARPGLSLLSHGSSGHQYASFLFPLSIEVSTGDIAWQRRLWEQVDGRSGWSLPDEIDALFLPEGGGFEQEFRAFIARSAEMDYPRYEFLIGPRDVAALWGFDTGTIEYRSANELPIEVDIDPALEMAAPEHLGVAYLLIGAGSAEDGQKLRYHFEAPLRQNDVPTEWAVEFVSARDGAMVERLSVEPRQIERQGEILWVADAELDGFGEHHDGAWMILAPLTDFGEGRAAFSYSARLVKGSGEAGWEELDGAGCGGCAVVSRRPAGLVLLLPLLLRRKRR